MTEKTAERSLRGDMPGSRLTKAGRILHKGVDAMRGNRVATAFAALSIVLAVSKLPQSHRDAVQRAVSSNMSVSFNNTEEPTCPDSPPMELQGVDELCTLPPGAEWAPGSKRLCKEFAKKLLATCEAGE